MVVSLIFGKSASGRTTVKRNSMPTASRTSVIPTVSPEASTTRSDSSRTDSSARYGSPSLGFSHAFAVPEADCRYWATTSSAGPSETMRPLSSQ